MRYLETGEVQLDVDSVHLALPNSQASLGVTR